MKKTTKHLLSGCSEMDFGAIELSDDQKVFYENFNQSILLLCKSLPESTQTDALLFFMEYSGLSIGDELDFFKNYYVPSWSILYWLTQNATENQGFLEEDLQNAITAQAMAMILHSLDDHINDQQVPASHLTLLIRSQCWATMIQALEDLSGDLKYGEKIIEDFINTYYWSILEPDDVEALESYCEAFRKQMATWLIVPVLMAKKMASKKEFTNSIQSAYESFGIGWRLLDDINDIETDLAKGSQSSVYLCLPEEIKKRWRQNAGEKSNHQNFPPEMIYDAIFEYQIVYRLQQEIRQALESAASLSDSCNMAGLANEYRYLLKPLKDV
jgi:hypothetical protein